MWILKPVASSRGRGIEVLRLDHQKLRCDLQSGDERRLLELLGKLSSTHLLQRYISPVLFDSHKFDLRVYVAVLETRPLRAFVYQDALVRFALTPWRHDQTTTSHITNYAVQRAHDDAAELSPLLQRLLAQGTSKCLWSSLCDAISSNSHLLTQASTGNRPLAPPDLEDLDELSFGSDERFSDDVESPHTAHCRSVLDQAWEQVRTVVLRTLQSVETKLSSPKEQSRAPPKFFDLLGFDILFDEQLRPHVLEVNLSPSLEMY